MPDYRELYLTLFRATEQAVCVLVEAQRTCEELYVSQSEPNVFVLKKDEEE